MDVAVDSIGTVGFWEIVLADPLLLSLEVRQLEQLVREEPARRWLPSPGRRALPSGRPVPCEGGRQRSPP
jgi:hypothetical protein